MLFLQNVETNSVEANAITVLLQELIYTRESIQEKTTYVLFDQEKFQGFDANVWNKKQRY